MWYNKLDSKQIIEVATRDYIKVNIKSSGNFIRPEPFQYYKFYKYIRGDLEMRNISQETKDSIVNILPKLENIEEEVIENLVEKIDDENNIVTLTWDKLNIKDVTYSVYVKDNKNGENGFTLYENSLQENYISIPIKEDFNIDVYVIGSKDGKFSKQSNIINVKIQKQKEIGEITNLLLSI